MEIDFNNYFYYIFYIKILIYNHHYCTMSSLSYEVSMKSMPWINSSKDGGNKRSTNTVSKYPIFIKLSERTDDPDWKSILLDAGKGKFPKGFFYNGNNLVYRQNNKIIPINDKTTVNKFIDFVRECNGFRSRMDSEREKDIERERNQSVNIITKWENINSKHIKKQLVNEYIEKLKKRYGLNVDESNRLSTLIHLNLTEDIIKKNIVIENGKVEDIKTILWNESARTFYLKGEEFFKKINFTYDNIGYDMSENSLSTYQVDTLKEWKKFLKDFNKIGKGMLKMGENDETETPTKYSSNSEYSRVSSQVSSS